MIICSNNYNSNIEQCNIIKKKKMMSEKRKDWLLLNETVDFDISGSGNERIKWKL